MVAGDRRILVVDDEQIVRESCQRVLTDAGYTVRAVGSGRDALAACRKERYDVLLTDLRMPDIDGLEIAKAMAKEFPETRVIVITGYPSRESAEEAKRLGVVEYLQKPLSPSRLTEAANDLFLHPTRYTHAPAPIAKSASVPTARMPQPVSTPPADDLVRGSGEEVPVRAPHTDFAAVTPQKVPAGDISTWKALGLLAVAPIAGLAFVVFLPLIGFGMLFAALGSWLGWKSPVS